VEKSSKKGWADEKEVIKMDRKRVELPNMN
jgi:hypothetical protein